jgi:hypothetical protein
VSTRLSIEELSPSQEEEYERFLHSCEGGLLYYSSRYRHFLKDLLGCQSRYWIAREKGDIQGVLPTMIQEGRFGPVLNSLPFFGSHGGILARNPSAHQALCEHYKQILREGDFAAATMVENPLARLNPADLPPSNEEDHRVGQFVDLAPWSEKSLEDCLPLIASSARRNVRKALKQGIEVEVNNLAMGELEACHREAMGAIGGNEKSPRFFELVSRHFRPDHDFKIYVASCEGQSLAALLLFFYHQTVEYFVPATRVAHRSRQPLPLIVATAMHQTAQKGFKRWNWGGTWPSQDGVYRFKKKWGSVDLPYDYFIQVNNEKIYQATPQELLREYPSFYVLPFSSLQGGNP